MLLKDENFTKKEKKYFFFRSKQKRFYLSARQIIFGRINIPKRFNYLHEEISFWLTNYKELKLFYLEFKCFVPERIYLILH